MEEPRRARGEADPDAAQRRSSRHTAWAAMPSPLPGKPRLGRGAAYADAGLFCSEGGGEILAHGIPVVPDLGPLADDDGVHVGNTQDPPTSLRTSRNPIESASL